MKIISKYINEAIVNKDLTDKDIISDIDEKETFYKDVLITFYRSDLGNINSSFNIWQNLPDYLRKRIQFIIYHILDDYRQFKYVKIYIMTSHMCICFYTRKPAGDNIIGQYNFEVMNYNDVHNIKFHNRLLDPVKDAWVRDIKIQNYIKA